MRFAGCRSEKIQIEIAIEIGIEKDGDSGINFDTDPDFDKIVYARRALAIQHSKLKIQNSPSPAAAKPLQPVSRL